MKAVREILTFFLVWAVGVSLAAQTDSIGDNPQFDQNNRLLRPAAAKRCHRMSTTTSTSIPPPIAASCGPANSRMELSWFWNS